MKIGIDRDEVAAALENEKTLALATCAGNRVTIRPMSHISDGFCIFFQTGADSLKISQIKENPFVALLVGTYEIEGKATAHGHPLARENRFFAKKYRDKHPGSFERYSACDDEIVVKIELIRVRQWQYVNNKPFLAEADFGERVRESH